nr:nitroreductase/quinone reductase family protein [Saccharopolyspora soli]
MVPQRHEQSAGGASGRGQAAGVHRSRGSGTRAGRWWKRAVEAFPDYAEYQRNTERIIPVLVLEPVTHQPSRSR